MVNWPIKKLGELVDFLDNQRKPISDEERQKRIGPYPYYGANGQVGWIDDFIFDEDLVLLAEDGGYFGSKDRPIAYRIFGKTWVNNHAHVLRVKRDIAETGFIHYRLMFYDIKPYITGSTRTKLNKSAAEKIKIPLPPLTTQKQIVERLDKIAEAQKLNNDLIQKSDELFQSLLHQELNPTGKDWEIKKLGEISEIYQPKTITSNEILKTGPHKVFGANGVIGYYSKYNHEDAEVLVTCRGATCGTLNMSEPKSWITGNAMVVHPKNEKLLLKWFLYYALSSSSLSRTITGTGQPQITRNSLAPFQIPLPLLETQKQIVAKLSAVQEYKAQLLAQKSKLKELFDSALHKSMSSQ